MQNEKNNVCLHNTKGKQCKSKIARTESNGRKMRIMIGSIRPIVGHIKEFNTYLFRGLTA